MGDSYDWEKEDKAIMARLKANGFDPHMDRPEEVEEEEEQLPPGPHDDCYMNCGKVSCPGPIKVTLDMSCKACGVVCIHVNATYEYGDPSTGIWPGYVPTDDQDDQCPACLKPMKIIGIVTTMPNGAACAERL